MPRRLYVIIHDCSLGKPVAVSAQIKGSLPENLVNTDHFPGRRAFLLIDEGRRKIDLPQAASPYPRQQPETQAQAVFFVPGKAPPKGALLMNQPVNKHGDDQRENGE